MGWRVQINSLNLSVYLENSRNILKGRILDFREEPGVRTVKDERNQRSYNLSYSDWFNRKSLNINLSQNLRIGEKFHNFLISNKQIESKSALWSLFSPNLETWQTESEKYEKGDWEKVLNSIKEITYKKRSIKVFLPTCMNLRWPNFDHRMKAKFIIPYLSHCFEYLIK